MVVLKKPHFLNMDEARFKRLRHIILESTEFIAGGISFDTYKAQQKGYPEDEIAVADQLLTDCSFYTSEFLKEIRLITNEPDACPKLYFVEFAKIIFILYDDNLKSTYMFEEDLHQAVLLHQYMGYCNEYLSTNAAS